MRQRGGSGLRPDTTRDLLLCTLWVLKNARREVLRATWAEFRPQRIQLLLRLLHIAVSCFEYKVGCWRRCGWRGVSVRTVRTVPGSVMTEREGEGERHYISGPPAH